MIEDLFELENVCNKNGLIIDPGIKNMYETLCNDQKFSALTEIHLDTDWNKVINKASPYYSYYSNPTSDSYILNYKYHYNFECESTYCIYFLHHTTLIPIYKIKIKIPTHEFYDVHTYEKPKEGNVWEYYGLWNPIQVITYVDKNDLKETIQQKFELLMQDD